ncbi:MAG TPA: hypothetical protein PKY81_02470 [bacterium]|nr:hypothetical protein [bacterium]HPN29800.1 hypothetical protein [bacterium]
MKSYLQCPECQNYFENRFAECQKCPYCGTEIYENAKDMSELKMKFYKKFRSINFFALGICIGTALIVWICSLAYTSMQTKLYTTSFHINTKINNFPFSQTERKIFLNQFEDFISETIKSNNVLLYSATKNNVIKSGDSENEIDRILNRISARISISNSLFENYYDSGVDTICSLVTRVEMTASEPEKMTRLLNGILEGVCIDTDILKKNIFLGVNSRLKKLYDYYKGYSEFYRTEIIKTQSEEKNKTVLEINIKSLDAEYKTYFLNMKKYEYYLDKLKESDIEINICKADIPRKPIYPNSRQSSNAGIVIGLILGIIAANFAVRKK